MFSEGAEGIVHEVAAAHGDDDRFVVVFLHCLVGVFHAIPGIGYFEAGFGEPVGAEVGEVCMPHESEPGVAPSGSFEVLHHAPVEVGVTGEDVGAVDFKQVVHGEGDALEVGPVADEEVEGLGA